MVTVVNFAVKRGAGQGAKWSTGDALFRLGEPAPGKGIRRFLLPGQETKVQAFALRRRAQIQPAALAVGQGLHLQWAGGGVWQIEKTGAVKIGDDAHRAGVRHGTEALRIRPALEDIKKVHYSKLQIDREYAVGSGFSSLCCAALDCTVRAVAL